MSKKCRRIYAIVRLIKNYSPYCCAIKYKFYIFASMRKILLLMVFTITVTFTGYSQYYMDWGFSGGATNYLGDIGGGIEQARAGLSDMKLNFTRYTLGGFFRYKYANKLAVKGGLSYIRLTGDDAETENPGRRGRNLSFINDMFELSVVNEFYIYKANDVGGSGRYRTDFNLYLYGGGGLIYSNPQSELNGTWYDLQPLETEGISYSKFNFVIPVGLGFYYTLQRKYRIGLEIGWRTTFTDYLDDVSGVYIAHDDPTTAALADKSNPELSAQIRADNPDETLLPYSTTYQPGRQRGNSEDNDSYLTATVNFSWVIRGRSRFYKSKHSWLLGKSKRRRRKSRAKF